jgi:hypothetical protein
LSSENFLLVVLSAGFERTVGNLVEVAKPASALLFFFINNKIVVLLSFFHLKLHLISCLNITRLKLLFSRYFIISHNTGPLFNIGKTGPAALQNPTPYAKIHLLTRFPNKRTDLVILFQ